MLSPQDQTDVMTSVLALAADAELLIRQCCSVARALHDSGSGLPEPARSRTAARLMDHTMALSEHIVRATERLTRAHWREDPGMVRHCRQMASEMDAILHEAHSTITQAVGLLEAAARERRAAEQTCQALLQRLRSPG